MELQDWMIILHVIPLTAHLIHLQYKSGRKQYQIYQD